MTEGPYAANLEAIRTRARSVDLTCDRDLSIIIFTHGRRPGTAGSMPKRPPPDAKFRALQQQGCLHRHPEQVTDDLFVTHDFFDPRDLVQVKYEMLRRVQREGQTVRRSAAAFGFSRPSFYQAQAAFQQGGLPALLPQKRGPKNAHKLTGEVLAFIRQARHDDPAVRPAALASLVKARYGITIHPRSIERASSRRQKKPR
jgi:transposase